MKKEKLPLSGDKSEIVNILGPPPHQENLRSDHHQAQKKWKKYKKLKKKSRKSQARVTKVDSCCYQNKMIVSELSWKADLVPIQEWNFNQWDIKRDQQRDENDITFFIFNKNSHIEPISHYWAYFITNLNDIR